MMPIAVHGTKKFNNSIEYWNLMIYANNKLMKLWTLWQGIGEKIEKAMA